MPPNRKVENMRDNYVRSSVKGRTIKELPTEKWDFTGVPEECLGSALLYEYIVEATELMTWLNDWFGRHLRDPEDGFVEANVEKFVGRGFKSLKEIDRELLYDAGPDMP